MRKTKSKSWLFIRRYWIGCCCFSAAFGHAQPSSLVTNSLSAPIPAGPSIQRPASEPVKTPEDSAKTPAAQDSLAMEELYREGIKLGEDLVQRFPEEAEAWRLLGNLHQRFGQAAQAVICWQRSLEKQPGQPSILYLLGDLAERKGQHAEAIDWWQKCRQVDPQYEPLGESLANAYNSLGKFAEATAVLREKLGRSPDWKAGRLLLGQIYQQLGQYELARIQFEAALQLDPANYNAHYGLFRVLTQLRQTNEARTHQRKFQEQRARQEESMKSALNAKTNTEAFTVVANLAINIAKLHQRQGEFNQAESLLKRAMTLEPHRADPIMHLAALYLADKQRNRMDEVLTLFKRARDLEPQNPHCHLNLGYAYSLAQQWEPAEAAYGEAIKVAPDLSAGYAQLSQFYLNQKRNLPEAQRLAREAVAREPSPANFFLVSRAAEAAGDWPAALRAVEKALELQPDNPKFQQAREFLRRQNNP